MLGLEPAKPFFMNIMRHQAAGAAAAQARGQELKNLL
jgi:hypothetical protein